MNGKFYISIIFLLISFTVFAQNKNIPKQRDNANFLAFSDIHFDPFYTCKSQSPCPMIQELSNAPTSQWETIFQKYDNAGVSPYKFDTNYPLLKSALKAANQQSIKTSPQFILILGDFLAHNFLGNYQYYAAHPTRESYQNFVKKTLEFITTQIRNNFPKTPIYPVVGNNDSYSGNYKVIPNGTFYKELTELWSPLIGRPHETTFLQTFPLVGYYSVTPPSNKKLRIILLNTVLFSIHPEDDLKSPSDQELQWLDQQLRLAQRKNQKVWIVSHIPPGINVYNTVTESNKKIIPFWISTDNQTFLKILSKYANTVTALITSHVHMDGFQIIATTPEIPDTFVSSISPLFGNNSSFKVYTYSKRSLQLENFSVYYLTNDNPKAGWKLEYQFNQIYQPKCLRCNILTGMKNLESEGSLSQNYQRNYTVNHWNAQPITKGEWYPYYWCGIHNVTETEYNNCISKNRRSHFNGEAL